MLSMMKPSSGAVVLGLVIALQAFVADASPGFTEDDLMGEIPVVSSVSHFEQRLEKAPASVTIITSELIALSGAQTFVDIFRLVPGFQAYHVGNNRYGISYHGIGREFPNQIEVMVDGRSVYETLFSSVNWSTLGIALADIDHIEVVRGSNAASQGSNAFMGSINIVTRKPVQDGGLSAEATLGDLQTRNALVRYSDTLGALDYRLSVGYERNTGFPAVPAGPMEDSRELTYGNVRATYTPTVFDTIDVSGGYAKDRMGWGDGDHPDEFSLAKSDNSFQSVKWKHVGDSGNDFEMHGYHSHFKTTNLNSLGPLYGQLDIDDATAQFLTNTLPPPPEIVALFSQLSGLPVNLSESLLNILNTEVFSGFGRLESERYDLEVQHSYQLADSLRGTWGLGGRYDALKSYQPHSYNDDIDDFSTRFFSHNEWQATRRTTVNFGAMVEDSHVGTLFSPRLSANYEFLPGHTLRAGYAKGARAPSLLEANEESVVQVGDVIFDILRIASPNLGEEKLEAVELAYLFQTANPDLSFDVRLFNEKVTHLINEVVERNPPDIAVLGDRSLKRIENGGYWQFVGGEMQLHYQISDATYVRMHYTHTDMDSQVVAGRFPDLFPPPHLLLEDRNDRLARHNGGVLLAHRLSEHWSASVMTYAQSKVRWEGGDAIDSFTRVDAQLVYDFVLGKSKGSIRLIAQNLGDTYSEFSDNNLFETRYFITAQLALPE